MEGIYIPMLKLADRGKMNETLLAMIRQNTRQRVETEGDVYSLAACNDIGCKRLIEMMREFGLNDLEEISAYICDNSKAAVLAEVAKLPKGTYRNTMTVDGYDHPVELVAALTISDSGIDVNYDGTSNMSRYGVNVPAAYTTAYTSYGLSCVVSPEVPNNAGSLQPFRISAPTGSILNAPYPAAVSSRHVIGQMLPDVVFGCLHQAMPDQVPAEGASCLWNLTLRGETDRASNDAQLFTVTAVTNGGTGARPIKDGLSATAFPSGVRGTPVEINESVAPLIFHKKELRSDSGGAGAHRGGLGQVIEVESAIGADFELLAAFDRIDYGARGRNGGSDGERGSVGIHDGRKLRSKGTQDVKAGERVIFHTPGGAGYGDPKNRDRDALANDIRDGLVSADAAKELY
jgi:N-methylhydantoinase B